MKHQARLLILSLAILAAGFSAAAAAVCSEPGALSRVRNRAPLTGAYEYVVFNFIKPPSVPAYAVTTATPPFVEDPSGNPVTVAGDGFVMVRFQGIVWTCEIEEIFSVPKTAIKDVKGISQFEGIVEYVVGHGAAARYAGTYTYDAGGIRKIVLRFRR
jgi:hypothetical protein